MASTENRGRTAHEAVLKYCTVWTQAAYIVCWPQPGKVAPDATTEEKEETHLAVERELMAMLRHEVPEQDDTASASEPMREPAVLQITGDRVPAETFGENNEPDLRLAAWRDLTRELPDPDQFEGPAPVPLWVKGRPGKDMPPREVTQDELRHLRLYPERDELSGGGLQFVGLLFFNAAERLPIDETKEPGVGIFSEEPKSEHKRRADLHTGTPYGGVMDGIPDGYLGLNELYERLLDHFENQAGVPPTPDAPDELQSWYDKWGFVNSQNSDRATESVRKSALAGEFQVFFNHPVTNERFRVEREYWSQEMTDLAVIKGKIFSFVLDQSFSDIDGRRAFVRRGDAEEWFSSISSVAQDINIPGPNYRTFGQIASRWAREPETFPFDYRLARPLSAVNADEAEAAVLEELVQAIRDGEFEPDGDTVLHIPDNCGNTELFSCADLSNRRGASFRDEPAVSCPPVSFGAYVKSLNDKTGNRPYPEEFGMQYGLAQITIARDDFARCCECRDWPFPNFWKVSGPLTPTETDEQNYNTTVYRAVQAMKAERKCSIREAQRYVARYSYLDDGVSPGTKRTFSAIESAYKRGGPTR